MSGMGELAIIKPNEIERIHSGNFTLRFLEPISELHEVGDEVRFDNDFGSIRSISNNAMSIFTRTMETMEIEGVIYNTRIELLAI